MVLDHNFGPSNFYLFFYFFYLKLNMYYSRTLADEAIYYSTIYPNSRDLGTAQ